MEVLSLKMCSMCLEEDLRNVTMMDRFRDMMMLLLVALMHMGKVIPLRKSQILFTMDWILLPN